MFSAPEKTMHGPVPAVTEQFGSKAKPSLLVVRPGALGDTILTLPALQYLKSHNPAANITFCGSAWADKLAPMAGGLYRFLPFDSIMLAPLFAESPPKQLPTPFRDADLIIVYTGDPRGPFVRNITALCSCPSIVWGITPAGDTHMAVHLVNALSAAPPGSVAELSPPMLSAPPGVLKQLRRRIGRPEEKPVAVVHPGSGSTGKVLPPQHFAYIINGLRRNGIKPVVLEGPADGKACCEVLAKLRWEPEVLRNLPLSRTAALLQCCTLFIGNDSGIAHLAGAVGARTVVLFQSTDPAVWKPVGPDVHVFVAQNSRPEETLREIEKYWT